MPKQEKRFTARRVDAQFEQFAQAALPPLDTPNKHVVESLRTIYGKQIQQEQQSIERMRQRLSLAVAARQQEKQDGTHQSVPAMFEGAKVPEKRVPARLAAPRPWLRGLEQGVAVLLVLVIVAGWFALSHLPRSSSGSAAVFNDASARPLGAPISTTQGNFTGTQEWAPDGRTFVSLHVDIQKHELEVHLLDVTTGRSAVYPVLDSSWIPALALEDPFSILMGRYLLAERAQGKNLATVEIWDITGQRAVTIRTLPAQIAPNGQVESPWLVPSQNERKLAMFSPDGTVTIWDVASGQKLFTCEGKVSYGMSGAPGINPPNIKWYNHDQSLLFLNRSFSQLEVWNAATGKHLFGLNYGSKTYIVPIVSPDNKYLALSLSHRQPAGTSTSYRTDTLEILDAYSGHVLHSYHVNKPSYPAVIGFDWLPDSQHLLMTSLIPDSSITSSSSFSAQIHIWNVFTGQTTFVTSFSQPRFTWNTPDNRYVILGGPDGRSMEIWQTSNGHKVATVATPGIYAASTGSFFDNNNQYMVIGQRGNFDIWDIATGKLLYKYHGTTPFSINGVSGSAVFWSPDGKYLTMIAGKATSIGDGVLSIWRMP